MVSASPLALRFPKQVTHMHGKVNTHNVETIDGNVHIKNDQQEALMVAPRKFSNVAKVIFYLSVQNRSAVTDLNCRLRIWAYSVADDPAQPDVGELLPGARLNFAVDFTVAAINNKRFAKAGSYVTINPSSSGSGSVIALEFDFFDPASVEFFEAWNTPETINEHILFGYAIETQAGSPTTIATANWGCVVVQAPSPANHTATYIPAWAGQQITGSGPSNFDRNNGTSGNTHDQIRGMFRWQYNADEWDGIESIHVWMYYGTGSQNNNIQLEVQRVDSEDQASGSTTTLFAETHAVTQQQAGVIRSQDILPFISDGDFICPDWTFPSATVTSGGVTATVTMMIEIVQRNCTKTVSTFAVQPSQSRQLIGIQGADAIPGIYSGVGLIDPQWFANYPDALFTKRKGVGTMVHDNAAVDPAYQLWMNSDLVADQNGPPGNGVTATSTQIDEYNATPTNDFPRWTYQEKDLPVDPINFAGQRKLYPRIDDSWIAGNNDHPGNLYLKYAYAVPNTEILDLGPLFPVGEFNPEGCASTSAGLGDPGVLVITNGSTIPKKFNPLSGSIEDAGIPLPFEGEYPTSIVVNNAASSPMGGIVPGAYTYRYTFKNCCTGKESDPNPDDFSVDSAAAGASPAASHSISFANVRIPADEQICEICVYRTVNGGAFPIMAKVGCFDPSVTTVFVDEVPDSELDFTADPLALLNAPMPCVPVVVDYRNRLFGLGDIPQLAPAGTVSVVNGSNIVTGDGNVLWDRCLEGKFIQAQGDCRAYEIERVLPPVAGTSPAIARLKLVEEYEGTTDTGLTYTICGHNNRLWFSEPLEPECWPNINFLDVEPGDGDKLIGGASNFDSLVICKRRKTYLLRFRENPLLEIVVPQRISTDIGCIAPRSFAQVENGTVWLSDRGLAMFDGRGVQHIPASDRFNEMLIDPDNPRYVRRDGQGRVIDAVGAFYPKREQYLLLLPTVQTSRGANVMLVWDTSLDNITLFEFCQEFQSMVVAKDADGNQRVYLGDVNGFVWMFDVGDTDGVGFPNATGTVRGTVSEAGIELGASFLEDSDATFITGGLPQLAALSGVQGLTPAFGFSPDESGELGIAGVCIYTRAADAELDDPWVQRTVYAATETRLYVTPSWGAETPDEGYEYMLGPIEFAAVFKPTNFGTDDSQKRDWKQVLTFVPQAVSSQVRVELLPDFANVDDEELTVKDAEGEVGAGRTFDLSEQRGRIKRPVGRRVYNFMQIRMRNFAPDEPVEILNHALLSNPRTQ